MTTTASPPLRQQLVRQRNDPLCWPWQAHPQRSLAAETVLRTLGLSTGHHIAFFSRIEEHFDIDWADADPPNGALNSLGGIADTTVAPVT